MYLQQTNIALLKIPFFIVTYLDTLIIPYNYYALVFMKPRVYKEGKRVSNALCTVCNMYAESHVPRIQILTNQSAWLSRFNCGRGLECSMNERENERKRRQSATKTSIQVESVRKSTKRASTLRLENKYAFRCFA